MILKWVLIILIIEFIVLNSSSCDGFLGYTTNEKGHIVRDSKALAKQFSILARETTPFYRHAKHYNFPNHHVAPKLFDSFEKILNPILEDALAQHLKEHPEKILPELALSHKMLEMRDGVKLSTFFIIPVVGKDAQGNKLFKRKPTIVARSPYGPTSSLIALVFMVLNGHNAVIQDQRGTFDSEGEFTMWMKDGDDGEDTYAYVVDQEWSDGQVFTSGISADGCGSLAVVLNKPPQLKGQLVMWSSADGHSTSYPSGTYREGLVTGWMSLMGLMTRGHSLKKTLPDILAHEELGPWWDKIEMSQHAPNVKWPMIHLSAWWDIFSTDQLNAYDEIRARSHPSVRDSHTLIVSPMGHCMLGNINKELASQDARAVINGYGYASEVFESMAKHQGPFGYGKFAKKLKRINIYVQGSTPHAGEHDDDDDNNNVNIKLSALLRGTVKKNKPTYGHYWSSFDNWPMPMEKRLYIAPGNQLLDKPIHDMDLSNGISGNEEFTYNPADPYQTHGGNNLILIFLGYGCGSMDQRKVESRHDVLIFTTPEPLKEPMAIVGNVRAVLHVSSNRNDTDFHVSLTDVHPDGSSMQVRFGIQRMRWRGSTRNVQVKSPPMVSGTIYEVTIDMWRTAHIFSPGHKVRITISSANTPFFSRNDDLLHRENPFDFNGEVEPALNRVHYLASAPSYIELPMVALDQIPENTEF